jgi:hypothetical protein
VRQKGGALMRSRTLRTVATFAVVLAVAVVLVPLAGADLNETDNMNAQGDGSAFSVGVVSPDYPISEKIYCSANERFTLSLHSIVFSGKTSCSDLMSALYGQARIVGTLSGNQASCSNCSSVLSSGSGGLVTGFPYTYQYSTTLQVPRGFVFFSWPPQCSLSGGGAVLTCTFSHNFTAE